MLDRVLDELGAGVHVQLQHNPGLVVLNRLACEMKIAHDFYYNSLALPAAFGAAVRKVATQVVAAGQTHLA